MIDVDKEIECLNRIIEEAISHGGDLAPYCTNGETLKEAMEAYLILRGWDNDYYVGNPKWQTESQYYEGLKIDDYLAFRKREQ